MFGRFESRFSSAIEPVFDLLVFHKDFKLWNPDHKVKHIETVWENCEYKGYRLTNRFEDRTLTAFVEVLHFEPGKEVRFAQKDMRFDDGKDPRDLKIFPFKHMAMRMRFLPEPEGCLVQSEFYLEPKGWLSWLFCRWIVLPAAIRKGLKNNDAAKRYLEQQS